MQPKPDRIEVKFVVGGGKIIGNIRLDHRGRRKICFIAGYVAKYAHEFEGQLPRHDEVWICDVTDDSEPDEKAHGALEVVLVQPRKLILPTADGGRLIVGADLIESLGDQPGLLKRLDKVAAELEIPRDGDLLEAEIDLGRSVGRRRIVPAPAMGYDDPCLFATRIGRRTPSRVLADATQGEPTSVIAVRAEYVQSVMTYRLKHANFGELAEREPRADMSEAELERSVHYWSTRAYVLDQRVFRNPETLTFRDVVEESRKRIPFQAVAA